MQEAGDALNLCLRRQQARSDNGERTATLEVTGPNQTCILKDVGIPLRDIAFMQTNSQKHRKISLRVATHQLAQIEAGEDALVSQLSLLSSRVFDEDLPELAIRDMWGSAIEGSEAELYRIVNVLVSGSVRQTELCVGDLEPQPLAHFTKLTNLETLQLDVQLRIAAPEIYKATRQCISTLYCTKLIVRDRCS